MNKDNIITKKFSWNDEKNFLLKKERGISFEEVYKKIMDGFIIDIKKHYNQEKYPNQKIILLNIDNYGYLIPFVYDKNEIFLKTIIPSRKITKIYNLKK